LRDAVDGFALSERVRDDRAMAFKMAADLDMKPEAVSKALAERVEFFAARYATLERHGRRRAMLAEIDIARRCLLPPSVAPQTE
jgi:hypothetical protein